MRRITAPPVADGRGRDGALIFAKFRLFRCFDFPIKDDHEES